MGESKASIACANASMDVSANVLYGSEVSSSPIRIALSGNSASICSPSLLCREGNSTTETLVTSLPVPQVVGKAISSRVLRTSLLSLYNSCTDRPSPNTQSFETSITVPPPIAIIRSYGYAFATFNMSSTHSSLGSFVPYASIFRRTAFPNAFVSLIFFIWELLVITKSVSCSFKFFKQMFRSAS